MAHLSLAACGVVVLLVVLLAAVAQATLSALLVHTPTTAGCATLPDIPADYCVLYQRAATVCPGLDWAVLAAIGKVESDHGRSTLPGVHHGENPSGAGGPMQFLQATFDSVIARHTLPPGGATPPSRYHPHDAIHAAAHYLCDHGADRADLRAAIFAYNPANRYVDTVLTQAAVYRSASVTSGAPTQAALLAVRYAQAQLGLPYLWGGDGPDHGDSGFDCSGLTKAAYAAAGITLPRTAQTQYNAGPHLPPGTPLLPGDLLFYGAGPHTVTHVGIAISPTHMINAPYPGAVVRIDLVGTYLGATRPAPPPTSP